MVTPDTDDIAPPSAEVAGSGVVTVAMVVATARALRCPGRTIGVRRAAPLTMVWHATDDAGHRTLRRGRDWVVERDRSVAGLPGVPVTVRAGPTPASIGLSTPLPTSLVRFDGQRRSWTVQPTPDAGDTVQLVLLRGVLRDLERERPIGWLTVSGAPDTVAAYAARLSDGGIGVLATTSIGATAMVEAPAPPTMPALDPTSSLDDALALTFGTLGATLLHWAPLAAGGDADAVHAMRVATRRARSALVAFRVGLGATGREWRRDLRLLAASLGGARDWDVFLDGTARAIAVSLPGGTTIERLLGDARGARSAAYRTLGEALGAAPARGLMTAMALSPLARPWRASTPVPPGHADPAAHAAAEEARRDGLAEPVGVIAPRLVDERWRRLMRGRHALDGLDDEALHDARKAAKTLRYTLEILRPAFPGGNAGRLIRRLGRAQDALGAVNDSATGTALMRTLPGGARRLEAGIVIGWLAARAITGRDAVAERWAAVRKNDRFWRG